MSTYLSLHYHVVFSTKHREPFIGQSWRSQFFDYIGGTINGLDGYCQGVGGTADHVHLLFGLKATHSLSNFIRELKKATSLWAKDKTSHRKFSWQDGYAAFTVSPTSREGVLKYIANQEEHHRMKSFREELEEFLQNAGVEYDPKYLV